MACEVLWAIVMGRSLASSAIGSVIRAIAPAERASLTGCGKPSSKCAGCPPLRPVAPQFGRPMRGCEMRGWPAHPRDVIGRHLNLSPQGVGNRAKVLGLPQRARHFRSPR